MYLSVGLFQFILLGFIEFLGCLRLSSNLESFWPVFLRMLSLSLYLSLRFGIPMVPMLVYLISHRSLRFSSTFLQSFFFLFLRLFSNSLIYFSACSNLLLNPSSEFFLLVSQLYFSSPKFLFGLFLGFLFLFIVFSIFFTYCFLDFLLVFLQLFEHL